MKKSCPRCGGKFNYEDSMGICPHCGKYASPYASKDNIAKPSTSLPVNRSMPKEITVRKQKKHAIPAGIAVIIAVTMVIIVPLVFTLIENEKIIRIENERKVGTPLEVEEHILQPFTVVVGGVDVEVTIESAKPFVFEGVKAVEGWKYIEVCHQVKSTTNIIDYSYVEVFLHWEGHYVEGLSIYELSKDEFVRDTLYDENIVWGGLERGRGRWVFLVPQEIDEATIEIYEEQDISNTKYQKLNKVYLVDIKVED